MLASILLVSALAASAFAAPVDPNLDQAGPADVQAVSDYFNLLAREVQVARSNGIPVSSSCNLAAVEQPESTLPAPAAGLKIKHIALGRGTQNYTCDLSNATAVPAQVGAVATLFNATCSVALYPSILTTLPRAALSFNLTASGTAPPSLPAFANLDITGHHYFTTTTNPFFNLDTAAYTLGEGSFGKNASMPAPNGQPTGQNGEAAVPWLRLLAKADATDCLQEVYRLETAGGSAPATCVGQTANIEVQYAAFYFFYSSC